MRVCSKFQITFLATTSPSPGRDFLGEQVRFVSLKAERPCHPSRDNVTFAGPRGISPKGGGQPKRGVSRWGGVWWFHYVDSYIRPKNNASARWNLSATLQHLEIVTYMCQENFKPFHSVYLRHCFCTLTTPLDICVFPNNHLPSHCLHSPFLPFVRSLSAIAQRILADAFWISIQIAETEVFLWASLVNCARSLRWFLSHFLDGKFTGGGFCYSAVFYHDASCGAWRLHHLRQSRNKFRIFEELRVFIQPSPHRPS